MIMVNHNVMNWLKRSGWAYNLNRYNRPCQLMFAGRYTSGHRRVQPRAVEAEFRGSQCGSDSCSEQQSTA